MSRLCPTLLLWSSLEPAVSVNRPEGGSVQGVQRGTWMEEGDQSRNTENIGERGKACMDVDKDRSRNSNCLLRRLLFSRTGLTACFFMHPLKGPVCVCLRMCVCERVRLLRGH